MAGKAMVGDYNLIIYVSAIWKEGAAEAKLRFLSTDNAKEVEERPKVLQAPRIGSAKRVVVRKLAESDSASLGM
eukprot:7752740-Lingulodinium_polyedra.AAC.1